MSMASTLNGLPTKPALRHLFLFQWYQEAHGGPTPRRSPLSRVYRWWLSLPPELRERLAAQAHAEIVAVNEAQRRRAAELKAKLAEVQVALADLRARVAASDGGDPWEGTANA
jgi:hypothetical protein